MAHIRDISRKVVDQYLELILPEFVRDYCEDTSLEPSRVRNGRDDSSGIILVPHDGCIRIIRDADILELVVAPIEEDIPIFLALWNSRPVEMKFLSERLDSIRAVHGDKVLRRLSKYQGSEFAWACATKVWRHRLAMPRLTDLETSACLAAIEESYDASGVQ